jgi:uncharacterized protein
MWTLPLCLALFSTLSATPEPLVPDSVETPEAFLAALQAHYTKRVFDIPMRDGVTLHTDVWVPKPNLAAASQTTPLKWPLLMVRTPYGIAGYGTEGTPDASTLRTRARFAPSSVLVQTGYIFVHQDVRGRLMSGGTFVDVRPMITDRSRATRLDKTAIDESTDAWDTIDFLIKNIPENNGRAGIWGISYPGFYAAQAAIDAHPALKAVSPQAPVTDWFLGDDFHHNGAFCVADAFGFYGGFGRARPVPTKKMHWDFEYDYFDAYDFYLHMGPLRNADEKHYQGKIAFWNEMMAHPNRDAWWQARDPRPFYKNIRPAALVVGGLFDAEDLWGAVETYRAMNAQSPASSSVSLVLGPWEHGGWHRSDGDKLGPWSFGQKTSVAYRTDVEAKFFESHLKGDGSYKPPEASVFDTGVNEWRSYSAWPPPSAKTPLYLSARHTLSTSAPLIDVAADAFVSDPAAPVPAHADYADELDHHYMVSDQRFAARRPDVVVYDLGELQEDVTIAGEVGVDVWFESDRTDADVVVKLVDILPQDMSGEGLAGAHRLVRGDIFRARFRNSFEKPEALVPGKPARVRFNLPSVQHTFRRGHHLAIHVQSSWFPLFDRNPQTFVNIHTATENDFVAATHKLLRSKTMPSSVMLPITAGRIRVVPANR